MHVFFHRAAKRLDSGELRGTIHAAAQDAFDALIAAVIFIAPLFMGGRGPVGKLALLAIVTLVIKSFVEWRADRRTG